MRRRVLVMLVLISLVALGVPLTHPTAAATAEHEPALVPGQPAHERVNPHDGVKLFLRYQDADRFYAVHANRRDGTLRIERKVGGGDGSDAYDPLQTGFAPTYAPRYDQVQFLTASVVDQPDGSVRLRLYGDGSLLHEAIDDGSTRGGTPLAAGHVGLRTDNLEFSLELVEVYPADAAGQATGDALLSDSFQRPDGLITNQRIQSISDHQWLVTSGSLFARAGRGWSGPPDSQRPTPDSRWSTNSSTFRMITRRNDLRDVAVSMQVINHGYIADPEEVAPTPPPMPPPYPTGEHEITADRLEGRSNEHVAIEVSQRAFPDGAADAVLISTNAQPTSLLGSALAGHLGAPLLLTRAASLHPDTALELDRLDVSRIHLIGDLSGSVASELRSQGFTTRQYTGESAEEVAAKVAREITGREVYLVTTDRWNDAASMGGAAAATGRPILLTSADRLHPQTAEAIAGLDVRSITVVGTELDASITRDLRAEGIEIHHEGHSRYSIAWASAEQQVAVGGSPSTVWLAAGSRPFFALVGGAAAAATRSVLLVVDGDDLGDLSPQAMAYDGYESKNWARYRRRELRRLLPIGTTDALSDRVVGQIRAPHTTLLAGVSDIVGTVHQDAIMWVLEQGVAAGFPDATYRPGAPVTRGQMASFLHRAFVLPDGDAALDDIDGTTHEAAIRAVVSAGIASGFPDGSYRPNDDVTRGQMATFLTRALDLAEADPDFPDVAPDATHASSIGAVAAAGIAGGFGDGTYRPGQQVTRGQMATFLQRAIETDT